MEKKVYTYQEYLEESKHKEVEHVYPAQPTQIESQEASTNNYPVPTTAVMPAPGDKITYYVRNEVDKSNEKLQFFPMLILNHQL